MCGIVGYVGREHDAVDVIMGGLRRLEYRGYDSAGVACITDGRVDVRRATGKLVNLETVLRDRPVTGRVGIGHTRWATHGKPSEVNAHPHRAGSVVVVHNGIIENYRQLRKQLEDADRVIESETDTELIAHLLDEYIGDGMDMLSATRATCAQLQGSYALCALSEAHPEELVVAKNGGSPMILGLGEKQTFMASDIPAILPYTREMIFLEDGDFALLTRSGARVVDDTGSQVDRNVRPILWDPVSAEKGGYDRFMQKEIFEQPRAIMDTIGTRVRETEADVDLDGIELSSSSVQSVDRAFLVACGTAYYACMVGKYLIEQIAGIPVEVDLASEFRYRKPILGDRCLMVPVSQSGETADTLAALNEARSLGARVLSICNVRDATIARASDDVVYTHAGPEIGVASTKAFTTQLVVLYLLARPPRQRVSAGSVRTETPHPFSRSLFISHGSPRKRSPARDDRSTGDRPAEYMGARDFLYLGRGINYPIALEGALKLKEISYIHAEGYRSRRDETRPHRPRRRADAGRRDRESQCCLREGRVQPRTGPFPRWTRDRHRNRRGHGNRGQGRSCHLHPGSGPLPHDDPGRCPTSAPCLPRGLPQGHRRRSAPQPRKERDCRVGRAGVLDGAISAGNDEIRVLAPGWRRLFRQSPSITLHGTPRTQPILGSEAARR